MPDRLKDLLAKYDWAKHHIDNFESALTEWQGANHYSIGLKHHSEVGYVTYYVKSVPSIDPKLSMILGDAIHNLRSTLDHLARALVEAAGGTIDQHTSFPILDGSKDYPTISRSKVKGLGKERYELLDSIQPYQGGFGHQLWQLHRLDIIDKHRMLLAIALKPVARTLTPSEKAGIEQGKVIFGKSFFSRPFVRIATNPGSIIPLESGHELGTFPVSDVDKEMSFAFDIAISEPEVGMTTTPVRLFLGMLSSQIFRVIMKFDGYL